MRLKTIALLLAATIFVACSTSTTNTSSTSTPTPGAPAAAPLATPNPAVVDDEIAVIETEYGKIKFKFYPDVAPRHVENFKKLTREKFYDGLAFHRVLPDNIIQGGDPATRSGSPEDWGKGLPGQPTVPAEFSTRPFVRGSIGMARKGGDNNSATSQFFICLSEHPEWNGQYTVFGEVVQGLETVRMISNVPSDPRSQKALEKIVINKVYLEKEKK